MQLPKLAAYQEWLRLHSVFRNIIQLIGMFKGVLTLFSFYWYVNLVYLRDCCQYHADSFRCFLKISKFRWILLTCLHHQGQSISYVCPAPNCIALTGL